MKKIRRGDSRMKSQVLFACLIVGIAFSNVSLEAQAAKPELWIKDKRIMNAKVQVMADRSKLNARFERWLDTSLADLRRILPEFGVKLGEDAPFSIVVGGEVPEELKALAQKERYPQQTSVIKITDSAIYITSPGGRGLTKAVYTFLDRIGVRWYTPGKWGESLPEGKVKLSKGSFVEGPDFLFRSFYWGRSNKYPQDMVEDDQRWYLRMRMDNEFGFGGHSYSEQIVPPAKYAVDHPEYYSLIKGERIAIAQARGRYNEHQLCVSNKEVQQLAIDFARTHFKKSDLYQFVSISPNDGGPFCQCGPCREIGGDMEQTVFLANVVARGVRDEYPDRWVAFYAYSSHLFPPEEMKLEPNVVPYIVNSLHQVGQAEWKYWSAPVRKTGLAKVIEDWATSGGMTAIRFNWGLDGGGADMAGFLYPYNWVSHLQDDFRFFHENKGVGVMAQSEASFIHQGWLNYWAVRLGWNVNLDVESEEVELYQRFYGPLAGTAKEALQSIQNQQDLARPLLMARLEKHVGLLKDAIAGPPDNVFRLRTSHLLHYLQFLLARERYYDGKESVAVVLGSLEQIAKDRSHALNIRPYYNQFPKLLLQKFVRVQEGNISSWRDPLVYSAKQEFAIKVEEPDKEIRFHLRHIKRRSFPGPLELNLMSPKGYLVYQEKVPVGTKLDEVIPVPQQGTYRLVVKNAGHFRMEVENPLSVAMTWCRSVNKPDKTITRYFYVPGAADSFIFMMYAPPQSAWAWFRLIDQTGQVRLSKENLKGTRKFEVKVPANARGKIWKLELGGEGEARLRFLFFGDKPAWLASEPNRLIVPAGYLR